MKKLTKNKILETLYSIKNELEFNYCVEKIAIVGSYATGKYDKDSDIDFLVEFRVVNFDNFAGLSIFLEKILGRKVDVIIKSPYLKKKLLESVEKEAIYV